MSVNQLIKEFAYEKRKTFVLMYKLILRNIINIICQCKIFKCMVMENN